MQTVNYQAMLILFYLFFPVKLLWLEFVPVQVVNKRYCFRNVNFCLLATNQNGGLVKCKRQVTNKNW